MKDKFKKIITILNLIAREKPGISKLEVMKYIYFAEKEHLIRYGRYIIGDKIVKLPMGPVESTILNILNGQILLSKEEYRYLKDNIKISEDDKKKIFSIREPELDNLSESEEKIIKEIVDTYRNKRISELIELTHNEKWWNRLKNNDIVTIRDIILGIDKDTQTEILEYQKELSRDLEFIRQLQ